MAFRKTGQFMDDLIMGNAMAKRGTIVDPTSIAASHAADQMRTQARAEQVGQQLGLAKQRLDENRRQFDLGLKFEKDQMDYAKDQGNISNIISGVGLGVSGLGAIKSRNQAQDRIKFKQGLMDKYSQSSDQRSQFFVEMLKYLE